jgi:hypothetical protein
MVFGSCKSASGKYIAFQLAIIHGLVSYFRRGFAASKEQQK